MTIDDIAELTLETIACTIRKPLWQWRHDCAEISSLVARHYCLDARLWQIANDGTGDQQYHVMLLAPDGRILDALECQARRGLDPVQCGQAHPFLGTQKAWGTSRGFAAQNGVAVELRPDSQTRIARDVAGRSYL
jgi:hypothetical protein